MHSSDGEMKVAGQQWISLLNVDQLLEQLLLHKETGSCAAACESLNVTASGGGPYHEDAAVAVSIDAPQFQISLGLDSGGSGSPID